jgi:hypothetical protein
MSTTYCDIDYYEDITSSLSFNEKRSVAATLAFSLAFSGGLACLAVEMLLRLQA